MRKFDLPPVIPIFPLPGAVLLPRGRLPLQIFEPRYLQMLEDVLKTRERLIGMVQERDDGRLCEIGGAGRVMGFAETDDGRYMITLGAVSRFRLGDPEEGFTPYRRAHVDWSGYQGDRGDEEQDPGLARDMLLERLNRFFALRNLDTDWDALREAGDEMLINALSMMLPFEPNEKQALLEARTLTERRQALEALLDYALIAGDNDERLQ